MDTPLLESSPSKSFHESPPRSRTIFGKFKDCLYYLFRTSLRHRNDIAIIAGPFVFLLLLVFLDIDADGEGKAGAMIAVMMWVFIWWMTEAVPIAITSLVPLFLLPFLQIQTAAKVSKSYMNDTVFLLIGSFILAAAVEHYNLHKRLALNMLLFFGGKKMDSRLLLLGFCLGSAFISMWIHNTAAAVMMMPVASGVLQKVQAGAGYAPGINEQGNMDVGEGGKPSLRDPEIQEDQQEIHNDILNFCRAVVLAVTYSVTLGGMATLTGTGVNMILAGMWQSAFPTAPPITYLQWMLFGFPLAVLLVLVLWVILCVWFCPPSAVRPISNSLSSSQIREELHMLGSMPFAEIMVSIIFLVLVILWLTKSFGTTIPGWGDLLNDYPADGTVSVMMATLLFVIPSRKEPGQKIMDWHKCKGLPWSIVLLLGGGFALADGIRKSGLSDVVSLYLDFLQRAPYIMITPIIGIMTGIVTEFTSNNATAMIFIALLEQVALTIHRHPLFLMVPATVGAQFSFMLPIATPPNAVGYSSGYLRMIDMSMVGFVLKVVGITALSVFMPTLGTTVFKTNLPFNP